VPGICGENLLVVVAGLALRYVSCNVSCSSGLVKTCERGGGDTSGIGKGVTNEARTSPSRVFTVTSTGA